VKFDQWDPAKYLNIWVVKTIGSGAAGYAYYPSSADGWPQIDGVIILSDYIGSIGTGTYFKARALTHEIGHYMDLEHVWGSTNNPGVACGDDGVADTPETMGWSSCNLTGSVCNPPIIENVQNYMEYAYCSKMFSLGQKQRMEFAITSTTANRNNLWDPSNLIATGTDDASFTGTLVCKPIADFKSNYNSVCINSPINFTDLSSNAISTSWRWTFTGGSPSTSTSSVQTVSYPAPGVYAVKLKVSNSQGADSITKTSFITVNPTTSPNYTISEGFESITLPSTNWKVEDGGDGSSWQIASVGATGVKSAKITNFNANTGEIDNLYSPSINLNASPNTALTFKVAYAKKASGNTDKLRVLVSKNCGQNWSSVYTKQGTALATTTVLIGGNFTPNSTQWRAETVTIPSVFIGANTTFKFEFTNGDGNNLYIDDINITSSSSINELNNQDFGIYIAPNPVIENATISLISKIDEKVNVEVRDILGKLIHSIENYGIKEGENIININASGYSKGLYFISVASDRTKVTQKMLVQ
jgi:PKD repeat protein